MSRRRAAEKRPILPDPKFGDQIVTKFVSSLMRRGMRSKAESILYWAIDQAESRGSRKGIDLFHEALDNIKPETEVRSRRVGGATYQVPVKIRTDRAQALAMRWMIEAARQRSEQTMQSRLAAEITEAAQGRGGAVKRRDEMHKRAESNRAFAHYRW